MLTISQLAAHAGVTVRAVRHYHATGLLPEPERDVSGYRRYDARAVVDLIRIRTLADAGVPLARVHELLQATDDVFAAAIAEIDVRLRAEIVQKEQHRRHIARLAAGDSLVLPQEAVAYLDRLRELGFPKQMVEAERDAWILVTAHSPGEMPQLMADKQKQLDDPDTLALYRALIDAAAWEPDDPRLPALADRLAAVFEQAFATRDYSWPELPTETVELLDAWFLNTVPIARRLLELLTARGWTGWTQLTPVDEKGPGPSPERKEIAPTRGRGFDSGGDDASASGV